MKYFIKPPLEAYTRTLIENRLKSLNYNLDEFDSHCNIYRERAKYDFQEKLLNKKSPDFLVYESNSSKILAVIEAKRPSIAVDKAIEQAIEFYAKPLNIPIVFVYNANSFYACTKERKPIKIDNIEISDFVNEQTLKELIKNNFNIESIPAGFTLSRTELIAKFKKANKILRKAGLRDGYERFSVFSDLMFLKLNEDFEDIGETSTTNGIDKNCWKKLIEKTPKYLGADFDIENSEVKSYLEDTIKKKLKETYGDVFETSLNINDEKLLIELIDLIDSIPFKNVDSDVKGDAFEFFLRNVTNGNKDLGEYYTPRHIVKMIVRLLNPQYGEVIYDPCCGTGGFLLECFKFLRSHTDTSPHKNDTKETKKEKEEKRKFIREKSIYGRELTSTSRIAKMNMILFGDGHTHIQQMDCLSKPLSEKFDIVVSNIPYSQKVEYGALYDSPSECGDDIFLQHIWKAVKKGGRIAVVVPETFLYDDKTKFIREKIINESSRLIIVSLPRGVFNPYTPTKTSIIIANKKRNSDEKLDVASMYVIRNDGFELGARRRPLKGQSDCNKFLMDYNDDITLRNFHEPNSIDVPYNLIKQKNYYLFPFLYMEHLPNDFKKGNYMQIEKFISERKENFDIDYFDNPDEECVILSVTQNGIYTSLVCTADELSQLRQTYKKVYPGDFTYNPHRINVGSIGIVPEIGKNMYVSNIYPVFKISNPQEIPNYWLLKYLKNPEYKVIINDYCIGGARADLKIDWLKKIWIKKPDKTEIINVEKKSKEIEKAYKTYLSLLKDIMD